MQTQRNRDVERKSFLFYRSFLEAANNLSEADAGRFFRAIIVYALDGKKINLKKQLNTCFLLVEPLIKNNRKNFINGCKGGAPKGNKNAKKQPKNNRGLILKNNPIYIKDNNQEKNQDKIKDNNSSLRSELLNDLLFILSKSPFHYDLSNTNNFVMMKNEDHHHEDFLEKLKNDEELFGLLEKGGLSKETVLANIEKFDSQIKQRGGGGHPNYQNFKSHFINWLKIRLIYEERERKIIKNGDKENQHGSVPESGGESYDWSENEI